MGGKKTWRGSRVKNFEKWGLREIQTDKPRKYHEIAGVRGTEKNK